MTDEQRSGTALIIGSIGGILTMAIHPVGGGAMTPVEVERLAITSAIAHSLALASFLVLFLGTIGLTRLLTENENRQRPDRLALSAIVVYGFACIAGMIATSVSGFIVPNIIRQMVRDAAQNAGQYKLVIRAFFQINQAFAMILSVTTCVAMVLWSLSAIRHGGISRGLAIYGFIAAPIIVILVGSGLLPLNVHGMGIVVLAQSAWFIGVGAQLRGPVQQAPA